MQKPSVIFWLVGKSWHDDHCLSVILGRIELNLLIRVYIQFYEGCYIQFCHNGITMIPEYEARTAQYLG